MKRTYECWALSRRSDGQIAGNFIPELFFTERDAIRAQVASSDGPVLFNAVRVTVTVEEIEDR